MDQFENIKCPTCGREYSGLLTTCPYCELGLDATTSLPKLTKEDLQTEPAVPAEPAQSAQSAEPAEPAESAEPQKEAPSIFWPSPAEAAQAEQAANGEDAESSVKSVPVAHQRGQSEEKEKSGALTGIICVLLGVAVLIAAYLCLRATGVFGTTESTEGETVSLPVDTVPEESDTLATTSAVVEESPAVSETTAAETSPSDIEWDDTTTDEPETDGEAETTDSDATDSTDSDELLTGEDEMNPTTDTTDVECDSIELNLTDISLFSIGETYTFTATVSPASSSEYVTWESSDIAVCTIDDTGTVTAVNGGTAEITASCGDQSASCIIRCAFEQVELEELFALNYTDITMFYPGEEVQLSVSNLDEASGEITWTSEDPSIATVSDGLVTAVSNGTTTISATLTSGSVEGQTMTCIIRCNLTDGSDSDVTLSGDYTLSTYDATMTRDGEYFQLSVTSDSTDSIPSHEWTSADTDVCYVDEYGVVYAVGNGTTTVSTTVDGQYLQCIVRVNIADE